MKNTLKFLTAAGCLMASALTANANLIVNGSFEQPTAFQSGGWALYSSIPGWTIPVGGQPIEVGAAGTYGVTGQHGNNVMELDSNHNVTVSQNITASGSYLLSFLYAQRSGVPTSSGQFTVWWNGSQIGGLFMPTSTVMTLYSSLVTAQNGVNTLTFQGAGLSNSYGALVDDVQLNRVPDSTSTLALLGGVLGLMGLAARRRS